jgi:hypothetical protein
MTKGTNGSEFHSLDPLAAKSVYRNLDVLNIMLSFSGRRLLGFDQHNGANTKWGNAPKRDVKALGKKLRRRQQSLLKQKKIEMKNEAHTSELKEIPVVVATSATESDLASLLNMRLMPRRTSGSV